MTGILGYMLINLPSVRMACLRESASVLRYLANKGADLNKEELSWTPVALAFSKKRTELVKMLMAHGATFADAGPDVLLETVRSGTLAEIKELLDYGMDPNCHDEYHTSIGVSFQW